MAVTATAWADTAWAATAWAATAALVVTVATAVIATAALIQDAAMTTIGPLQRTATHVCGWTSHAQKRMCRRFAPSLVALAADITTSHRANATSTQIRRAACMCPTTSFWVHAIAKQRIVDSHLRTAGGTARA